MVLIFKFPTKSSHIYELLLQLKCYNEINIFTFNKMAIGLFNYTIIQRKCFFYQAINLLRRKDLFHMKRRQEPLYYPHQEETSQIYVHIGAKQCEVIIPY